MFDKLKVDLWVHCKNVLKYTNIKFVFRKVPFNGILKILNLNNGKMLINSINYIVVFVSIPKNMKINPLKMFWLVKLFVKQIFAICFQ